MPTLFNAQNAHVERPSIVVGAIASYSANSADRDTEHRLSTLRHYDLAEASVVKGEEKSTSPSIADYQNKMGFCHYLCIAIF